MVIKGVRKKQAPKVQPVTKVVAEPEIKKEEPSIVEKVTIKKEEVLVEEASVEEPKKEPRKRPERKRAPRNYDSFELSQEESEI